LVGLGDLANKYENVRIQTHLSECWPEVMPIVLSKNSVNAKLKVYLTLNSRKIVILIDALGKRT